jgi:hypothetical protein
VQIRAAGFDWFYLAFNTANEFLRWHCKKHDRTRIIQFPQTITSVFLTAIIILIQQAGAEEDQTWRVHTSDTKWFLANSLAESRKRY